MIPYGTFTFFLVAFIVLLPVIILGFLGKRLCIQWDKYSDYDCDYFLFRYIQFIWTEIFKCSINQFCNLFNMASAINHVVLQIDKNNTFIKFLIIMILSILPLALKILQKFIG